MWSFSCVLTSPRWHSVTVRFDVLTLWFASLNTPFPSAVFELQGPPKRVVSCTQLIYCQNHDCVTFQTRRLCEADSERRRAFCSVPRNSKFLRLAVWAHTLRPIFVGTTVWLRGWHGHCCPWAVKALGSNLLIWGCWGLCHLDSVEFDFVAG
jgi:hypothetical protein